MNKEQFNWECPCGCTFQNYKPKHYKEWFCTECKQKLQRVDREQVVGKTI